MTPTTFSQVNSRFGAPQGLDEAQCKSIPAFKGEIIGGSCDGLPMVVVAWKPSAWDLERLNRGESVFLTVIGGLPPHFLIH